MSGNKVAKKAELPEEWGEVCEVLKREKITNNKKRIINSSILEYF